MRSFYRRTCRIVVLLLFFVLIQFSVGICGSTSSKEFPVNLLFSKADVPRIIENTKLPMFKEYWQSLLDADMTKDNNFMREAFLYVVTGDKKRGELAREGMLKVLEMERWDYFLEDGKYTIGFLTAGRLTAWMSLSYDWIYDLLSPGERSEILKQIAEKGCVPCYRALYGMRYPESVKGWSFAPDHPFGVVVPDMSRWPVILGHNNFRAVISGGFALGMYTLMGKDERVREWYEMIMDSYDRFTRLFEPDGSYDEAVSYCNYAMTYLIYLMEVVKRKQGIELFDAANYIGMMDFNLALFMPHHLDPGGSVNFGDSGKSLSSGVGFWVARKSRDGLSQHIALNYAHRHDVFSFVYYDPAVKPTPPSPHVYFRQLALDWIVTRTGYEPDDLVVAMRSGKPANHEHADRNSVILKYGGEILLADQNRPTYDFRHPGWFLRTSLAHNTVVIDGKGQQYHNGEEGTNAGKSSAKIVRAGERSGYCFWASDATHAYALVNDDVKSVTRTTLVFPDFPCLIVIDKLMKFNDPSLFVARWFAENRDKKATCSVKENTFMISRPNSQFFGVCAGSQGVNVQTTRLSLPDSVGVFPYVDTGMTQKVKEGVIIMAGTPLFIDEKTPEIEIRNSENLWFVEVAKGGKKLTLKIFDRDALPEFEVLQ